MSKTSPQHYQLRNGFQVIDLTEALDFCSGNVVKYVARAGNKEGESALDDLEKALWYLVRKIENVRKSEDSSEGLRDTGGQSDGVDLMDRNGGMRGTA